MCPAEVNTSKGTLVGKAFAMQANAQDPDKSWLDGGFGGRKEREGRNVVIIQSQKQKSIKQAEQ